MPAISRSCSPFVMLSLALGILANCDGTPGGLSMFQAGREVVSGEEGGESPRDESSTGTDPGAGDPGAYDRVDGEGADGIPASADVAPTDAWTDAAENGCQPGDGAFGCPCTSNDGCRSNWCVAATDDRVCTMPCSDGCPRGWVCREVRTPEPVYLCTSRYPALCRPCVTSGDCLDAWGAATACVDFGPEAGRFCGGACVTGADCPEGAACNTVATAEGNTSLQCVPTTGTCACSLRSIERGLGTVCSVSNAWGTCSGTRTCMAGGLTACDAPAPAEDLCGDNLDQDCDGIPDDGFVDTDGDGLLDCVDADDDGDGDPDALDCAPLNPAVHHGATDVCNGTDDDCDGATDEDYQGGVTVCGVGACAAAGQLACDQGVDVDTCRPGEPALGDVTCDGVDDDCDGVADEDYAPVTTTCGRGACERTGQTACDAGIEVDLCEPGEPSLDDATCDAIDDDCDGTTDDDYLGAATACGAGACAAAGFTTCSNGLESDSCSPGAPDPETCNGLDDDCDGATDNDACGAPGDPCLADEDCRGPMGGPDAFCRASIDGGARFCAANGSDCVWTEGDPWSAGQVPEGWARCVDDGHTRQCLGGAWGEAVACPAPFVHCTGLSALSPCSFCVPGAPMCVDGATRGHCGPDGQSPVSDGPCPDGAFCAGDALCVNGEERVANQSSVQDEPDVAWHPASGFVVVWRSKDQGSTAANILGRRMGHDGQWLGSEFRVNQLELWTYNDPAVAMRPDGGFVVTWTGGPGAVHRRAFGPDGAPVDVEQVVPQLVLNRSHAKVDVAVNSRGDTLIAYMAYGIEGCDTDNCGSGIGARAYDASWQAADERILNETYPGSQNFPSVAALSNDDFVAVWGSDYGNLVKVRVLAPDSTPRGPEFDVDTIPGESKALPSVAARPDGKFVVTWDRVTVQEFTLRYQVFARVFANNGEADGPTVPVSDPDVGLPTVAVFDDAAALIGWDSAFDSESDVVVGLLSTDMTFGGAAGVAEITAGNQRYLALATTRLDTYLAAWVSYDANGIDADVHVRVRAR